LFDQKAFRDTIIRELGEALQVAAPKVP
jgi:hypothetical protein